MQERARFAELFHADYARLCRIAARLVRDRALAERIVSESFVTVWRRRADVDWSRPYPVAVRTVIDDCRAEVEAAHRQGAAPDKAALLDMIPRQRAASTQGARRVPASGGGRGGPTALLDDIDDWEPDATAAYTRLRAMYDDLPADTDTLAVTIGDLTVVHRADAGPAAEARQGLPWSVLATAAALVLVAGVLVAVSMLSKDDRLTTVTPATAGPARLGLEVSLSTTRVRYGEPVVVTYSWRDGDGDLVNTNEIGVGAVRYLRNVPCTGDPSVPHPSSGQGTWTYTPGPLMFGPPPTKPTRVRIGYEVQTGGCAPEESRRHLEPLTVLPPLP